MKAYVERAAILCALALAAGSAAIAQAPSGSAANAKPAAADKSQVERQTLGPFGIAGEQFSVIVRRKLSGQASGANVTNELSGLQIIDRKGSVVYERNFDGEIAAKNLSQLIGAQAELLPYTNGNALLIRYQTSSSQTHPAAYSQVFGFIKGKLGPYSGPVEAQNAGPQGMVMGAAVRGAIVGMPMMQQGDPVELRMWTGNFYIIVPMLVDWSHTRVLPAQRCFEAGGPGLQEKGCDLRVEAVRKPASAEMSFVRVFQQPQEFEGGAKHVVINKDSNIRYLAARSIVRWLMHGDLLQATFPDLWLKILIDNDDEKEGWIHTEEEFEAVGLPAMREQP